MNERFIVYMVDLPEEVRYHFKGDNIFINSKHYANADEWVQRFLGLEAAS